MNKKKKFDGDFDSWNVYDNLTRIPNFAMDEESDPVNSPTHYTQGTQEAIDIIEEAIDSAPSVQAGMLQAQVLKYLLRIWHKDNPRQDAEKAQWYLKRLIDSL